MDDHLFVAYSSDDNYAMHAGVSILSLFERNETFEAITVFVLDNHISEANRNRIQLLAECRPGRRIEFLDATRFVASLKLNVAWEISLSAYVRLFVGEMIPQTVDRLLYVDCDTLFVDSVWSLWRMPLEQSVAGVFDTVPAGTKAAVGLAASDRYINSGVLLINLAKWRSNALQDAFLSFMEERGGCVIHHDQGVVNGVLHADCLHLPLRFNLMTHYLTMSRDQILDFYQPEDGVFSGEEIAEAFASPCILHFTPGLAGRPWCKGCSHPLRHLYLDCLARSPWKDYRLRTSRESWRVKLVLWGYRNLPYAFMKRAVALLGR